MTDQLFNSEAFEQIKGQTALDTDADWCEEAGCPREQCVSCQRFPIGASVVEIAHPDSVWLVTGHARDGWTFARSALTGQTLSFAPHELTKRPAAKRDSRPVLERVRALFPAGAVVECVENTYIPARAGTRRVVVKSGKSVCECEMDGKPYRMSLPTRVSDVVAVTDDSVTFKLQGYRGPERLAGHTCTFRVLS